MFHKTLIVVLFVLIGCGTSLGQQTKEQQLSWAYDQSPLHGLTAGQSARTDAERVLGKPVKELSPTLVEYHPQEFAPKAWENVTKVYVQYRKDAPIVERIEMLLTKPLNRADAIRTLRLPDAPAGRGKNAAGNLQEYFGAPNYVVLTYQGAEASSGVARTARYSRELFAGAVPKEPLRSGSGNSELSMENNVDRVGQDYRNFDLQQAGPDACRTACANDPNCQAYTYVRPGAYANSNAWCWLKSAVAPARPSSCCVSGAKGGTGDVLRTAPNLREPQRSAPGSTLPGIVQPQTGGTEGLEVTRPTSHAQASFQGLTPGVSTRADVERVLGQSVDGIRRIMSEYKAPAGVKWVMVFYNNDNSENNKVVMITVYLLRPVLRSALIQKFNLPQQADAQKTNSLGALQEYFGQALVSFSNASSDASSGVIEISYYDESVFAGMVREARKKQ